MVKKITPNQAAEVMGCSPQFIRIGMQRNLGVSQQSNPEQCLQFGGRICKVTTSGSESNRTSEPA